VLVGEHPTSLHPISVAPATSYSCGLTEAAFTPVAPGQLSEKTNQMKKLHPLILTALAAFTYTQAWAQQSQTSSIYSIAVTTGVAAVAERTGIAGNTPVAVDDNLAGMTYVGGNFGLTGAPVATTWA